MSGFDGRRFLRTVPNRPGVYTMVDEAGKALYVGKAKDLKKRLAFYFRDTGLAPKTAAMMRRVADVRINVTLSDSEALLLESNLIKTERPRFNIVLRDDKSYPYIYLDERHPFPRLSFYRGNRRQPGRYFGPYPSAHAVRSTLALMQKIFPIRQCRDTYYRNRSRPCLQYQIHRCTAPCVGLVDEARYGEDLRQAVLFLEGKDTELLSILGEKMEQASAALEFENAARYRDRIQAVQRIAERQYVESGRGDADVIALVAEGGDLCMYTLFIRGGRSIGGKARFMKHRQVDTMDVVMAQLLAQHYIGRPVPPEIIVGDAPEDRQTLAAVLTEQAGSRVEIRANPRGHRARWLQTAALNGRDSLNRQQLDQSGILGKLEAVKEALTLAQAPQRIECFDISHTRGEKTVGACVVFDTQGPKKSDYRRYNVAGITAGDDYAALAQVVERRYRRQVESEAVLPDLILIDGGKGQVNRIGAVLEELQLDNIPMIGVAKGTTRKAGFEQLVFTDGRRPMTMAPDNPALHLIQQVRDEAHRFAIAGHRGQRGKARKSSTLEQIPGIGARRRRELLNHFGGLREISRASVDDIASVPGISKALAERIYAEFHDTV